MILRLQFRFGLLTAPRDVKTDRGVVPAEVAHAVETVDKRPYVYVFAAFAETTQVRIEKNADL